MMRMRVPIIGFYTVFLSSVLSSLPFPSCSVLEFFDGWQILTVQRYHGDGSRVGLEYDGLHHSSQNGLD